MASKMQRTRQASVLLVASHLDGPAFARSRPTRLDMCKGLAD